MKPIELNEELMEFFFEDMESQDSVVLRNYSAHVLNEYVSSANDEQKQAMREAILKKDIQGVIKLLKTPKD